jgi:hypothetical protein
MSAIDEEIRRVKAAVKRAEVRLSEMNESARGSCCATCAYGRIFVDLADAQERRTSWLAILLEKRGLEADVDLARAIRMDAWP